VITGPRHRAREAALQTLYLWEVGRASPDEALDAFFAAHQPDAPEAVRDFATELVRGTAADVADLDRTIVQHSAHWRLDRLALVDRMILRMALWELRHQHDTPAAVVIDEAIELARTFSTDESVKFVNGVLDGIRKAMTKSDHVE
jgi:N utilization substance protein B